MTVQFWIFAAAIACLTGAVGYWLVKPVKDKWADYDD